MDVDDERMFADKVSAGRGHDACLMHLVHVHDARWALSLVVGQPLSASALGSELIRNEGKLPITGPAAPVTGPTMRHGGH